MPDDQTRQHRTHDAAPETVRLVDDDTDDGLFRVRMPITSTGEARDGVAFERSKIEGFRDQIAGESVPAFLNHGRNPARPRYGAGGKIGYLANPSLEGREGRTDLDADFVVLDPDSLPDDVGPVRGQLQMLRAQAEAGVPLACSIGWSDDTGDRDLPGGSDLLEVSVVGIPSDPNTTTAGADTEALARAVDTASDGFDPEAFVRTYRKHRDVRDTYAVGDDGVEIDITPPEAMENAAALALSKAQEGLGEDCGTGVGTDRAQQIVNDDVGPDVIDEVASYLTSHAEDVTADGPPSDWSDEEWDDCGNLQYAKWGGTGSGEQMEWAQGKANEVAEARGEELPYPERAARNLDDPAFSPGDAVMWTWQDEPVHGRVNDVHEEHTPPAADEPITGEDGEAVYSIYEFDEATGELADEPNVAKPESSLDDSTADIPTRDMTDTDESGEQSETDDRDEQPDVRTLVREMEEKMDEMREMIDENTRLTREMHEEMYGEENADNSEDMDEGEDDEDEDGENSAADEHSDERMVTVDGEEKPASEALADLRSQVDDAEAGDAETSDRADTGDEDVSEVDGENSTTSGFGFAAMEDN